MLQCITLHSGDSANPVTLPITNGLNVSSNASLLSAHPAIINQHEIPSSQARDKKRNLKQDSLEMLHPHLVHRK
jgi:hypothetical protein